MNPSDNNSFGMQNIPSGQGAVPMAQMTSRDTGDIVLPTSGKKTKKWPIVVLAVLVVIVVTVPVALGAWMTRGGDDGENTTTFSLAYNSYANYVLFGEDADGRPNTEDILLETPYFEKRQSLDTERYIEVARTKYDNLVESCNASECEYDLNKLAVFFQGYGGITVLSTEELETVFADSGETQAKEYVVTYYSTEYYDENLDGFLAAEIEIADLEIDTLAALQAAGCDEDDNSNEDCDNIRDQNVVAMLNQEQEASVYSERMQVAAMNLLAEIYGDLYNDGE